MLAVHIQLFAFPSAARWNPTAYGDFSGLNWAVWLATSLLADGKFISIFAMLLGASIVMTPTRADAGGRPAWVVHALRMSALLVLGLVHAYGLWYGDMLVPLALCGAVVYFARSLSPKALLVLGITSFAVGSAVTMGLVWSLITGPPSELADWRDHYTPRKVRIVDEINHYQSGWSEQMRYRVPMAREVHSWGFVTRLFWQMSGLMLLGMALYKLDVLSAVRGRRFYSRLATAGFTLGIGLVALGLWRSAATNWDITDYVLVGQELKSWGNVLIAAGWVSVVMLLCQRGWRLAGVAEVGRLALSNYLLQSLICTTIFYGHGLGLFGEIDRAAQVAIVVLIWGFELVISTLWLRRFSMGPVEWVVRWVAFGHRPHMLRAMTAAKV